MPPDNLVDLINQYMEAMVSVIVDHGGMITRFGGDSILVFLVPRSMQWRIMLVGLSLLVLTCAVRWLLSSRPDRKPAVPNWKMGLASPAGW